MNITSPHTKATKAAFFSRPLFLSLLQCLGAILVQVLTLSMEEVVNSLRPSAPQRIQSAELLPPSPLQTPMQESAAKCHQYTSGGGGGGGLDCSWRRQRRRGGRGNAMNGLRMGRGGVGRVCAAVIRVIMCRFRLCTSTELAICMCVCVCVCVCLCARVCACRFACFFLCRRRCALQYSTSAHRYRDRGDT